MICSLYTKITIFHQCLFYAYREFFLNVLLPLYLFVYTVHADGDLNINVSRKGCLSTIVEIGCYSHELFVLLYEADFKYYYYANSSIPMFSFVFSDLLQHVLYIGL